MKKFKLFAVLILLVLFLLNSTICYAKSSKNSGKGYLGILPDLTRKYAPKNSEKKPVQAIPAKDFNSDATLKPVPADDPTFVNIILKPEKVSKYVKELYEFIPMLEEISDIIDDNENVQIFNAKVYYFNKSADYFRDKYNGKPESNYISYKKLMELNTHARSVALLRSEALKYNPYLAYHSEGYVYNPNNIQQQIGYLKTEIEETILILREAK